MKTKLATNLLPGDTIDRLGHAVKVETVLLVQHPKIGAAIRVEHSKAGVRCPAFVHFSPFANVRMV